MKTKIVVNYYNNEAKFMVYRKSSYDEGFFGSLLKFWESDQDFKTLEAAERHAEALSKHPHPVAIYNNGKKIK